MAENFAEKYGVETFEAFVAGLCAGESGQHWADKLGVSRERVRQWKRAFVREVIHRQPSVEVKRILKADKP